MPAETTILIIDEDRIAAERLAAALRTAGVRGVGAAATAPAALQSARNHAWSLLLFDPAMEHTDGWELFRSLRLLLPQVPVIILSGKCSVRRRVQGLELGADDYICKPCDWTEFMARLRAVIRRHRLTSPVPPAGTMRVADLEIDIRRHRVSRGGTVVELTPREYRLLIALASAAGRVVSHDALRRDIWGLPDESLSNAVAMAVSRLRRKVDAAPWPPLIHKVHGFGYRLVDPAAVEAAETA